LSEFQNAGKGALIDLVGAKLMQLEMSFQEAFSGFLFAAGKYNQSQTSKNPAGMLALVSETPNSYDAGGVDTSVETWWQNKVQGNANTTFTWIDSTSARATGVAALTKLYNNCSKGTGGAPDFCVGSQAFFQGYENNVATLKSMDSMTDQDAAAAGFANLKFRGMNIFWDEQYASANCSTPATTPGAILLNTKFIRLRYASSKNFSRTPWMTPNNQDARSCLVLWYGNMTIANRRKHGVLVDYNATDIT
jgi:hypothetical protein